MAHAAPEDLAIALRPLTLVLGLADSTARARWLEMGYADAMPAELEIHELSQRAARTIACRSLSSSRRIGRLRLDLLARDGRVESYRLRLHPREFALLWRLAEVPGASVNRAALLRDVFELDFDPGTNRLAVHVCRLRKKLAIAGLTNLLATAPGESAYRLDVNVSARVRWDERGDPPQHTSPDPLFRFDPVIPLDPSVRFGEHARSFEELAR